MSISQSLSCMEQFGPSLKAPALQDAQQDTDGSSPPTEPPISTSIDKDQLMQKAACLAMPPDFLENEGREFDSSWKGRYGQGQSTIH